MGALDAARLLTACSLEAVSSLLRVVAERVDPEKPSTKPRWVCCAETDTETV